MTQSADPSFRIHLADKPQFSGMKVAADSVYDGVWSAGVPIGGVTPMQRIGTVGKVGMIVVVGSSRAVGTLYAVRALCAVSAVLLAVQPAAIGEEPKAIVIAEKPAVGARFHVVTTSTFQGELRIPQAVSTSGTSDIEYYERILPVDPKEADHKTLRAYTKIRMTKKTKDRTDEMTLRPAVRRIVLMKRGADKVPFSPDGPLTFGEIDMIRTETMPSALAGMLPLTEVRPNYRWSADKRTIQELTDLREIRSGTIDCTFAKLHENGPRKVAEIHFGGTVAGVSDDGPVRQKIDGKMFVDLSQGCMTLLQVQGELSLFDDKGKEAGKITGNLTLTRTRADDAPLLTDELLKKLDVNPSATNTELLYRSDDGVISFAHSRRWKVVRSTGRQITIDEAGGQGGILITLDPPGSAPTLVSFQRDVLKELKEREIRLTDGEKARQLAEGIDHFGFSGMTGKDRKVKLDYYLITLRSGSATVAANLSGPDSAVLANEVERIVRSFRMSR